MGETLSCFTAYDVRGKVPDELNEEIAAKIALAFVDQFSAKKVVIGRDMRLSSSSLTEAVIDELLLNGVDIIELGLCGTEEVYHAVFSQEALGIDGGIMITASHNPADYNGMKIVQKGARPVSGDSGLVTIRDQAGSPDWYEKMVARRPLDSGKRVLVEGKQDYIDHLLGYVDIPSLKPMKLVMNMGNGCAGPVVDLLEKSLPFECIKLHHEPDGTFPNGVPNPLLPEKREVTAQAIREHKADLGVAWDGDFDRCFLYDENGRFIEGYYIVGLLGVAILKQNAGATILHDPRLIWNTQEMVGAAGGNPVMSRTGHAFIKEKMRELDAVYGGEMSAHHYFRSFGYCDSGMIPWLLVCQLMSLANQKLSSMVNDRLQAFPVSGEINSTVKDPDEVIKAIARHYPEGEHDYTDGLSIAYPQFRLNVRKSNTEPVLRLNLETRGDLQLLEKKTAELLGIIKG